MNESETIKPDGNSQQPQFDQKSVRESKGLTLKDICETTKVSMIYLQAIENEEFKRLPPPVYSKSFIAKYAEAIGIDSSVILERYNKYLNAGIESHEQEQPPHQKRLAGKFIYIAAGMGLAAIIVVSLIITSLSFKNDAEKMLLPAIDSKPPAESVIMPEAPAAAGQDLSGTTNIHDDTATKIKVDPAQKDESSNIPPIKDKNIKAVQTPQDKPETKLDIQNTGQKPYVLTVFAKELSWLKITGDDTPYEVLLKPGEKIERSAAERFLVKCGNAGGVDIAFQGKPLGILGKPGEVIHLTLP
ncbi:MAG: helix-turn-helix domain-containing protein [Deltaproteobacteria bacterium]|nr:helix-turn-helix domain-containing protein [Deltaproteobacteria bacterium]